MLSSCCDKLLLKMSNMLHEVSKKTYVRTEMGGCVYSKVYSRIQGGWVGQKCGDFESTYFMDDL